MGIEPEPGPHRSDTSRSPGTPYRPVACPPMLSVAGLLLVPIAFPQAAAEAPEAPDPLRQWPSWRGPLGTGYAPHADPPTTWSEERTVRWKTALPGEGHATPIVFGDRVFLTTAVPVGEPLPPRPDRAPGAHDNRPVRHRQSFEVLALDRATGEIVWRRKVAEGTPHEGGHVTSSHASPSPVTDGSVVVASFGSSGLYGLDVEGGLLWSARLPRMRTKHGHGEGSSPALAKRICVVIQDHEGASSITAFDALTGQELWSVPREEPTSWATPIVVEADGRDQVIVSGTNHIRSYDLKSGELVWQHSGLSHNVVASPVHADGVLYAGSSYERQILLALRLEGAEGDLTGSNHLLWVRRRTTPYVPSPLLEGGSLWFLKHYQGVLVRLDVQTGEQPEPPLRLERIRDVYASPVAAAGRLYVTGRDGTTAVLSAGPDPRILAWNRLEDVFDASAAVAGNELYLRGSRALYCLAAD